MWKILGRFSVIHKLLAYNNNTLQMNGLGNFEIPNPFFLLGMMVFEHEKRCALPRCQRCVRCIS